MDLIAQFSAALAARVAAAAPVCVALTAGDWHGSGILWRPDTVITSEEALGHHDTATILLPGTKIPATLAGRDPATNIAVFRLETPLPGTLPPAGAMPRVGSLALILGADTTGAATARLAMVHATGPEWHGMAGGRIDALIRLDVRLGTDEGGPVLDASGAFLGMAAAGPRRRALVIPAATIARVVDPLLKDGRIARGFLGVGLRSVAISEDFRAAAGQTRGAMVLQLAPRSPAGAAGVLPGDILLALDGQRFGQGQRIVSLMEPERIGQAVVLRLLRGADAREVTVTVGARPGG